VADTVTVKFKVMEDGSLKAVGKDAEKAAAALNKAGNTADTFKKKQKGVANATSNSTKAFSKMTTGIQGGLVPAYAEIAARVFALTAAFGVLSRNDAIAKLQEGIEFTGRAAGRNLTFVADKLQEITDNAISAEAAMRATAVGVSAGFSEQQMAGLAEVAKGASLALGRDMSDAMDRLIRGAAKLEPEILDELGIMVRLDEASENYARTLNKTAGELTQFEKRMAFTNAIIEQGRQKFDGISEEIEASNFSQLAASLQDVAKTGIGLVNKVLGPMAGFLAENTIALGALVALYAGSVAGAILGGITSMAEASARGAQRTEAQSKAALKGIKPNELLGKAFNEQAESQDRSSKSLQRMQKSLNMTINMTSKDTKKLKAAVKMRNQLTAELYRQDVAQIKMNMTNALGTLQEQGLMAGIRAHVAALGELNVATRTAMASQSALYATMTFGRGVMIALASTARFLGAAFLSIMGPIGMVLSILALVGPALVKMFGFEDTRLEKQIKRNEERFEEFNKVLEQYNKTISKAKGATQIWAKTLEPLSGLLTETATAVSDTIAAARTQQILKQVEAQAKLNEAIATQIANEKERKKKGGNMTGFEGLADSAAVMSAQAELKNAGKMAQHVKDQVEGDIKNSMAKFLATSEGMAVRLRQLGEEGENVGDALAVVSHAQREVNDVLMKFSTGKMSAEEARAKLEALSISATSAYKSFTSFSDIVNKAEDLVGNITSTWGVAGEEIDNLSSAILNINAIINSGKGAAAGNKKAKEILEAYGIIPGKDPVAQLKAFKGQLVEINAAYKDLEMKEAEDALVNTGAIQSGITILTNLDERLRIKTLEINALGEELIGTEKHNKLLLEQLAIRKQIQDAMENQGMNVADRDQRIGGDIVGATSRVGEGMFDFEMGEGADASTSERFAKLNELSQGMMENLKNLGPDGEFLSVAMQGALQLGEAFSMAFEDIGNGGDKMIIGMEAASAAFNVIGNLMAAQSQAQVSAIDQQIAAEKKRDGSSAASLAKIKALEKKKEQIKRKAFEQDKKMKMATVITSTAAAIMKEAEKGIPASIPGIAFFTAMGMAQLAAISSATYQGGGSISGGAGKPQEISVGSRSASVDLARGENAGGELAYARGERGIGSNMTNFRPAFAGYKNRAAGGFVVGEQGPELFMPEVPGEIIPSGRTPAGQTNVNFSISTVDATGVEDLLMNQRGNIIGMIREAANEHGEMFLESVQEKSY
jgi:hypothetical protein